MQGQSECVKLETESEVKNNVETNFKKEGTRNSFSDTVEQD